MKTETVEQMEDGTYRYEDYTLTARASDGTYWVAGLERWMTLSQLDDLAAERSAE